jgi:hypothetical protein
MNWKSGGAKLFSDQFDCKAASTGGVREAPICRDEWKAVWLMLACSQSHSQLERIGSAKRVELK